MQEVIFDLQTITPIFLAGAEYSLNPIRDQRQRERDGRRTFATHGWDLQAEMRPPSLRGLMRYWLRAAVGGLLDTTTVSLDKVIQFEQSVFGTTDQASAITLRIADVQQKAKQFRKGRSTSEKDINGRDYLLWSMAESGGGEKYKFDRWYFPEGTRFKVVLSERVVDPATPYTLPYAVAALWLLTSLGGIGARSRRCAGSLMVEQVKGTIPNLPFTAAKSKEDLQAILRQGILEIRRLSMSHLQELQKHDGTPSPQHALLRNC
ncbi:MAG: type III-B CRISPR module RAMP protein Cmr1 [Chloroflexi bacterium]|nr:type III-B CRISPR module RAMP protein Cmr1 [Chloroflexota bacterium]